MKKSYDIAVVGGGAAGFFAAIHAANAGANRVVILEKTTKMLTKVAVSGGGRCNVTHNCEYAAQLVKYYPRGGKKLKKSFELFGTRDTIQWFEKRGVPLKTEDDGRMFPISDHSQTIINCLMRAVENYKVECRLKSEVENVSRLENGFVLKLKDGDSIVAKSVIVATGGFNKLESYRWLSNLGLNIEKPIPSLFTFNVPQSAMKDLMGLSVPNGEVIIPGTKWKSDGPILITHWGFSAPAVIKLSAWAAKDLHEMNYKFPILINWVGKTENEVREVFDDFSERHPAKVVHSNPLFYLPSRLWERLCTLAEIEVNKKWIDLSKMSRNKLMENLIRQPLAVSGKTTFKEEFVTCGGVSLNDVELTTFESKKIPGLYLVGEVLDVDGVTGGFNFQHAWTSGYLAGMHAAKNFETHHLPKGEKKQTP